MFASHSPGNLSARLIRANIKTTTKEARGRLVNTAVPEYKVCIIFHCHQCLALRHQCLYLYIKGAWCTTRCFAYTKMPGTRDTFFDPDELRHVNIAFVDPFQLDSSNYFARGKHQDCNMSDPAAQTTTDTSAPNPAVHCTPAADCASIVQYGMLTPEIIEQTSRERRIWLGTKEAIEFKQAIEIYVMLGAADHTAAITSAPAVHCTSVVQHGILTPGRIQQRSRKCKGLRAEQAIEIYAQLPSKTSHTAVFLAYKYGVTSKAIRDIWTGKTWSDTVRSTKKTKK